MYTAIDFVRASAKGKDWHDVADWVVNGVCVSGGNGVCVCGGSGSVGRGGIDWSGTCW